MNTLIKDKVFYKIFDKSFKESLYNQNLNSHYNISDYLSKILKNKDVLADFYEKSNSIFLKQIHSNIILDADLISDYTQISEGDGIVTTKTNLVLVIQTADCVPVLVTSADGSVIGAAHCGWRPSFNGIIKNLITLMRDKGGKVFKAFIGPSIQQYSYEVGEEFFLDFLNQDNKNSKFFIISKNPSKYLFDLPRYVETCLRDAEVDDILKSSDDTYSNPSLYPSYRRSQHTGETYDSSILSTIIKR